MKVKSAQRLTYLPGSAHYLSKKTPVFKTRPLHEVLMLAPYHRTQAQCEQVQVSPFTLNDPSEKSALSEMKDENIKLWQTALQSLKGKMQKNEFQGYRESDKQNISGLTNIISERTKEALKGTDCKDMSKRKTKSKATVLGQPPERMAMFR